jgi:hypothetical protein
VKLTVPTRGGGAGCLVIAFVALIPILVLIVVAVA